MWRALEGWDFLGRIEGYKISNLRYVDDTILIATTKNDLEELIGRVETISQKLGLKINRQKTKVMIIDRQNDNQLDVN